MLFLFIDKAILIKSNQKIIIQKLINILYSK